MTSSYVLKLVYVLILLTLQYSAVQSTWYHVAQSKDIRECADDTRCVDFAAFLHNTSKYISSNSTITFYPGLYEKTSNLNASLYSIDVIGVTNVTISTHRGVLDSQRAEIHCNTNFKVMWRILRSQNIHIENMAMIGCSAHINVTDLEHMKEIRHVLQKWLDTTLTLLLVRVTNIIFKNIRTDAFNHTALLGLHVDEGLNIKRSYLSGKIVLSYQQNLRFTRNTKIHIENSAIIPAINREASSGEFIQEGLVITYSNTGQSTLVIKYTTFYGHSKINGFCLKVYYNPCYSSTVHLIKLNTFYAGILISRRRIFTQLCKNVRNSIHIEECHLTKMCSKCGLQITGGDYDSRNTLIKIVNSTFSDSKNDVELFSIEGFVTNTTFVNNNNALKVQSSVLQFQNVYFKNNKQGYDGFSAILVDHTDVHFKGTTVIERNTGNKQAAMVATQNSTLFFEDEARVHFNENQGFYGGALSLYKYSVLNIKSTSRVTFNNNHAWRSGGAIYVDSQSYKIPLRTTKECFYYQSGKQKCNKRNKNLLFCNNTSVQGGDSIYAGSIDDCRIRRYKSSTEVYNPRFIIHCIMEFCNGSDNSSVISSSPYRLCFCTNKSVLCDTITSNITAVPGETIELSVVAVGERYGITIATVQARLMIPDEERDKIHPHISQLQTRQQVYTTCTKLQYTIFSPKGLQRLIMSTTELANDDVIYRTAEYEASPNSLLDEYVTEIPLSIYIRLQTCSIGFVFNQVNLGCQCHPYLGHSRIQCTLQNQTIHRSGSLWVNATENSIVIHRHCPLGYCKTENMELSLSSPDTQCSLDRSGTLCGQCRGDLSQVLGSLNCKKCSDFWLFLVIPATLISGVVLVLFLMTLNLTVSTGTINGLIFYANIVRANNAIFFSSQSNKITTISKVFIAWINLDLGIEVCFYNGLDAYAKTLFQLAFPLYICTIVAIIIISSHYSTLAAKLSGRNAVQVLATLFLLSYSKAIRLVITALSFTNLTIQHYPNNTNTSKPVWLYDGNVDYLQGKHIALFLIGILILVLVSLPYTTILLFSQCLQKISHYKGMSWVWKIKPLFDAYTGPYKNKHRYWTGLLLLVRVILYAIFSLNIAGDPAINLLAICIFMLLTLAYLVSIGRVYKSRSLTILECTFLINLAVLSTSTLYAIHTNRDQEVITNISVILSFIVFCGVLILHTYKRVMTLRVIKKFTDRFKKKRELVNDQEPQEQHREENFVTRQVVSIKDLEEPLIEREEIM